MWTKSEVEKEKYTKIKSYVFQKKEPPITNLYYSLCHIGKMIAYGRKLELGSSI